MLGRYQRCSERQLNNRGTAHGRADTEFFVIINRRGNKFALGPGKKHCAFVLERGARVAAAFAFGGELWLGDSTDGVDGHLGGLDDLLVVTRAERVEGLVCLLQSLLQLL